MLQATLLLPPPHSKMNEPSVHWVQLELFTNKWGCSQILWTYLRHMACRLSGSIGSLKLLFCFFKLGASCCNSVSNCPTDRSRFWSGCGTVSAEPSRGTHQVLLSFSVLGVPRHFVFFLFYQVIGGPGHRRLMLSPFLSGAQCFFQMLLICSQNRVALDVNS